MVENIDKTEKLLNLSKRLVDIKEKELNALNYRLSVLLDTDKKEFVSPNAAPFEKASDYLETVKELSQVAVETRIIQVEGEFEGAKEQVKDLENQLLNKNDN